jgi:hypothetical protein
MACRGTKLLDRSFERKIHMMNRHERRRTRKARENKFYTGYVKHLSRVPLDAPLERGRLTVPGSDTPAAREWDLRLKRIRADSLALCNGRNYLVG